MFDEYGVSQKASIGQSRTLLWRIGSSRTMEYRVDMVATSILISGIVSTPSRPRTDPEP